MSDIPSFPYDILWEECALKSVANLTRKDGAEFFAIVPRVGIVTRTMAYPLVRANKALADLRSGRLQGAAVPVPWQALFHCHRRARVGQRLLGRAGRVDDRPGDGADIEPVLYACDIGVDMGCIGTARSNPVKPRRRIGGQKQPPEVRVRRGGGAILRRGNLVIGVTTAATLWYVTVIGLCFGGGQVFLGLATDGRLRAYTITVRELRVAPDTAVPPAVEELSRQPSVASLKWRHFE